MSHDLVVKLELCPPALGCKDLEVAGAIVLVMTAIAKLLLLLLRSLEIGLFLGVVL